MRINKAYSPELQRDLRDIKHQLEQAQGGQMPAPRRVVTGGGGGGGTAQTSKIIQVVSGEPQPGTVNGDLYINGTLLVNGSPPLYSESNILYPTFSDPVRAIDTVYQNTETTMKVVQIVVKLTG